MYDDVYHTDIYDITTHTYMILTHFQAFSVELGECTKRMNKINNKMHLEISQNEHQEHRGKNVNREMSPKTKQLEDQFMTFKWLVSMVSFGPLSIVGPLPSGLTGLYVAVTILSGMALQVDSLNHACWKDTFIFDKVT